MDYAQVDSLIISDREHGKISIDIVPVSGMVPASLLYKRGGSFVFVWGDLYGRSYFFIFGFIFFLSIFNARVGHFIFIWAFYKLSRCPAPGNLFYYITEDGLLYLFVCLKQPLWLLTLFIFLKYPFLCQGFFILFLQPLFSSWFLLLAGSNI